MAKQLKKFTFTAPANRSKYPYREWLTPGTIWQLESGSDYEKDTDRMVGLLRMKGRHLGVRVAVEKVQNGIVISASEADEETKGRWAAQIDAAKEKGKERAKAKRAEMASAE